MNTSKLPDYSRIYGLLDTWIDLNQSNLLIEFADNSIHFQQYTVTIKGSSNPSKLIAINTDQKHFQYNYTLHTTDKGRISFIGKNKSLFEKLSCLYEKQRNQK